MTLKWSKMIKIIILWSSVVKNSHLHDFLCLPVFSFTGKNCKIAAHIDFFSFSHFILQLCLVLNIAKDLIRDNNCEFTCLKQSSLEEFGAYLLKKLVY